MKELWVLTKRNTKLYFKDKGAFYSSLITPMILLVLYVAFLGKVYKESFTAALPQGFSLSESVINGVVAGQLISSLLAVMCVTVSFCANMTMVSDKVSGAWRDMMISPMKRSRISLSYYVSAFSATMIIALVTTAACFIYLAVVGWYMSFADVLLLLLDIVLLVLFGTALSSIINCFLSSQGQISAVGTIVSSGYGFICGAYMPIASFGSVLQKIISFFPGTYGTSLLHNHALKGTFAALEDEGVPSEIVGKIAESIDCKPELFGTEVSVGAMYAILSVTVVLLIAAYVLINVKRQRAVKK